MRAPSAAYLDQPEFQALVDVCLADPPRDLGASLDFGKLVALAERHRVQGLVAEALVRLPAGKIPADIAAWAAAEKRNLAIAYLTRMAELSRLVGLFSAHGIPTIALKGNTLAQALYAPHPELRQSIDIDLIVAPERVADAERVVIAAGYVRDLPLPSVPPSADSMARYICNAYEYAHPELGQRVELHHRLVVDPCSLAVPFDDLLERSEGTRVGDTVVRSLAADDLAIYLCAHAAGHLFFRLKWLADLVRVLDRLPARDVGRLLDRGKQLRCEGACVVTLLLIETLTERRFECLDDATRAAMKRLIPTAMAAIQSKERADVFAFADVPDDLAHLVFSLRIAPDWRSRRFAVLMRLVNHRDLATLGLGVAWAPVYAILGRPLALGRWLTRKIRA